MTFAYIITSLNMSDNLTFPHEISITDELDEEEVCRLLCITNAYSLFYAGAHIYCPNKEVQNIVKRSSGAISYYYNVEVKENLNCIVFSTEIFE